MEHKLWGGEPYYGLGYDFDPQWYLTDAQKDLQKRLIEACHDVIRPEAIRCDETGEYPWKSVEALAELRLLGCIVPERWGGSGENHVGLAMIGETVTRYGCPSTGVIFMMHMAGLAALLFRAGGNEEILSLLRRLDSDVMIGSASFTDPETGGHFWYPKISAVEKVEGGWRVRKKASFTTSCGHARWVVTQTTSPGFDGDYSDISDFLVYADELKADPGRWDVMGMRATVSGPVEIDAVLPENRLIGAPGDGAASNDEAVNLVGMILYGALYNGVAMGALDLARRYTTQRRHAQYGQSVADYPTTQAAYGKSVIDTQVSRGYLYALSRELDRATGGGDWTIYEADPDARPRTPYICWGLVAKEMAARVAGEVADAMFNLYGGAAYSRRLEIERVLRDSKAGWIMGPTNEVTRGIVGRWALHGHEASTGGTSGSTGACSTTSSTSWTPPASEPSWRGWAPNSAARTEGGTHERDRRASRRVQGLHRRRPAGLRLARHAARAGRPAVGRRAPVGGDRAQRLLASADVRHDDGLALRDPEGPQGRDPQQAPPPDAGPRLRAEGPVALSGAFLGRPRGRLRLRAARRGAHADLTDCDEMQTFFFVDGPVLYVDDDNNVTYVEDNLGLIRVFREHFEKVGLGADFVDRLIR